MIQHQQMYTAYPAYNDHHSNMYIVLKQKMWPLSAGKLIMGVLLID